MQGCCITTGLQFSTLPICSGLGAFWPPFWPGSNAIVLLDSCQYPPACYTSTDGLLHSACVGRRRGRGSAGSRPGHQAGRASIGQWKPACNFLASNSAQRQAEQAEGWVGWRPGTLCKGARALGSAASWRPIPASPRQGAGWGKRGREREVFEQGSFVRAWTPLQRNWRAGSDAVSCRSAASSVQARLSQGCRSGGSPAVYMPGSAHSQLLPAAPLITCLCRT